MREREVYIPETVVRRHRCRQPRLFHLFPRFFSSRHVDPLRFFFPPFTVNTLAVLIATIIRGNEWLVVLKGKHNRGRPNVSPLLYVIGFFPEEITRARANSAVERARFSFPVITQFSATRFYHAPSSRNEFFFPPFERRNVFKVQ